MFTNKMSDVMMRMVFIIFSLVSIESYTMPYMKKSKWVSKKNTCKGCIFANKCNITKVIKNYEKENMILDEENLFLQEGELSMLD
tara:strand:+ start:9474 stop:9728 length:255 start_codon:yes stop_codon:yes gene_type:complete